MIRRPLIVVDLSLFDALGLVVAALALLAAPILVAMYGAGP